jgi:hypothetical protein
MTMSGEDGTMRKRNLILGALVWVALAMLMPLAALEPVHALARTMSRDSLLQVTASCADGSASLIMGCASIHL